MVKLQYTIADKRIVRLQAWKLRDSNYIVQLFIGNVEARRWVFSTQSQAKDKMAEVFQSLANNHQETLT